MILRFKFLFVVSFCCAYTAIATAQTATAYTAVLKRLLGEEKSKTFVLTLKKDDKLNHFQLKTSNSKVNVVANSEVALCSGVYFYLKHYCNSIISWSGSRINIPAKLPYADTSVSTPYQYHYYFNVVTNGYTTAYWNWQRWEKEIDWMAMHGINMPLLGGAHEAILYRVFQQFGLSSEEAKKYFSGPAYFPWNRMGNLQGWDGNFPDNYFDKQIKLAHQVLNRCRQLGMKPIVHAFAGFVPPSLKKIYPNEEIRELQWGGGLPKENNSYILAPGSKLFEEIGVAYIKEWEKEFGKNEFYLADSFNEMDVPLSSDSVTALNELSGYGLAVYNSVSKANPQATWVMQGWTFPFHRDNTGKLFWTPARLNALVSKVPDDKLLILDLANEYNKVFWKIDPSWKMYEGFFGKQWIFSYIPNMGGKIPFNGKLDVYASLSEEALNYDKKRNLVGFGFAPEGTENNEVIYELLSDMIWQTNAIDLDQWINNYCMQRYGAYPPAMKKSWDLLRQSGFGTFTDHPTYRFQLRPYKKPAGVEDHATAHRSKQFAAATAAFLSCKEQLGKNKLYLCDAIELTAQFLASVADKKLILFLSNSDTALLNEAATILLTVDTLLATHPNYRLDKWLNYAKGWGDNKSEKNYYETDARRIITTWGGDPVNDYSNRLWSGLIRDYYVPRWLQYHNKKMNMEQLRQWEEQWINKQGVSAVPPYKNPMEKAITIFEKYKNEMQE